MITSLLHPCCFTSFLLLLHILVSLTSCIAFDSELDDETPFTYVEGTGKGPKKWGQINPHWKVCDNGHMQSPIDILDRRVQDFPNLGKLRRDYKPAPAAIKNRGRDIEIIWKGDAGKISINGTGYKLKQCHWHSPSEHTFNDSRYALELHLVHFSSQGNIAVIGIAYKYGRPDRFLSRVRSWISSPLHILHCMATAFMAIFRISCNQISICCYYSRLRLSKKKKGRSSFSQDLCFLHASKMFHYVSSVGKEERDLGIVNPGDIKFGSRKYYRYTGSLTVPPCTEGVLWTIVKKVRTVSREQVRALRYAVHDGFEANARPTQPLDGRQVYLYNPSVNGATA